MKKFYVREGAINFQDIDYGQALEMRSRLINLTCIDIENALHIVHIFTKIINNIIIRKYAINPIGRFN